MANFFSLGEILTKKHLLTWLIPYKNMSPDSLTTLHAPASPSKTKKRVLSLQELREKNADKVYEAKQSSPPSPKPAQGKKKRSVWFRCLSWFLGFILSLVIFLSAGLAYLTSPMGEGLLTECVESGVNYLGKPLGLRIQLTTIRGFWEKKIQIYDLRIFDPYGPWLRIDEGTLHPQWSSIWPSLRAVWNYRHDKDIPENLFKNKAPLTGLVETNDAHFSLTEFTEDGVAAPSDTTSLEKKDVIESLLTAEQVLDGKVTIGLRLGTLVGVYMPRAPRYHMEEDDDDEEQSMFFPFFPSWFALDIGEIELAGFQLGPQGRSITISARMHGQINATQIRLRTSLLAAPKIASQWVLPSVQELPADITLSFKQLAAITNTISNSFRDVRLKNGKDAHYILGFGSLDYDSGDVDLRWQCRDSVVTPNILTGAKSIWSRARVLAQLKTWPPTPENPLLMRVVKRFGMALDQKEQNIKPSLASGQLFWDGSSFVVRDFKVQSPIKDPSFDASGSFGMSQSKGFGAQFHLSANDIKKIASMVGVDVAQVALGGAVTTDFYVSRGGEYLLWWAKPLPEFQQGRVLQGFSANPHDYSQIAKHVQNYTQRVLSSLQSVGATLQPASQQATKPSADKEKSTVAASKDAQTPTGAKSFTRDVEVIEQLPMPVPSKGEEGLRFRLKIESPELSLPQGKLGAVFYTVHGTSADRLSMPRGTAYTRKTPEDEIVSDFTEDAIPRGLVGTSFLRVGDTLGLGPGTLNFSWFVGGAHDASDVFQARLSSMNMNFPGINNTADLSFAYALPRLKRRWPWVDGNVYIDIDNWRLVERLTGSPVYVENFELGSAFKSFVDEMGAPAQYMNVNLGADKIEAPQFMVRRTQGTSESKHLHALADAVGLSIGKLRDALTRKMEYTPPKDYPIFTSKLSMSSGRGGPVRWSTGSANVLVAGEQADFDIRMLGDINALLEGLFKFRTRTLELKEMQISSPPESKKK